MLLIPLRAARNQTLTTLIGNQNTSLHIYQTLYGVFMDVAINENPVPIIAGSPCENLNRIVRYKYLGFKGDLFFFDSQGDSDPEFTGLGNRYNLYYLEESELADGPFSTVNSAGGV